ncbi:MAG: adenosylcobinamide-GDP ribazoletransferase [Clostridium sp.]
MKDFFNNLLLFFQFFTRIPIKLNLKCEMANFRRGAIFFPIIGLFIGAMQYTIYRLCIDAFGDLITATFVMLAPIILTGGLHVDGLGDTCDGFFSFKGDKYKIMEVMKDSRVGTYASIATIGDMLMKYVIILTLISSDASAIIIIAPIISRLAVVFTAFISKNAKENGSGNIFIGNINLSIMLMVAIITIFLSIKILGITNLVIIIPSVLIATYIFNIFCNSKIGGQTGDTLGAVNELMEILTMLIFIAIN